MPIISIIGRKQRKMRVLIAGLYIILTLGAVTMVYPFLLMVSTSFTSQVDQNEFRVIPRYFYDETSLYRKYIESKYDEDPVKYNIQFGTDYPTFETVEPPKSINRKFVAEWREFKATLPLDYLMVAHAASLTKITPETLVDYRAFLRERFNGDLDKLNKDYREANETWLEPGMPIEDWTMRNFSPDRTLKYKDFLEFKAALPVRYLYTVSVDGLFQDHLRLTCGNVDMINKALGLNCETRADVRLPARMPGGSFGPIWEEYVRRECPVHFVHIDDAATAAYDAFIKRKYVDIAAYNRAYKTNIKSFSEVKLSPRAPVGGMALVDWIEFLESAVPIEMVDVRSADNLFRQHLAKKYGTVERMNQALGLSVASFEQVAPPYAENDLLELRENTSTIRWEFISRNYREVLEYIALHGRALMNTAILCFGMVAAVLIVNPLCAYALSRFNLRSTYKILLFLLATMAFPAEVSAIPSFLLIKDLHLLGTYWAIILPALANGYSVFLLKGFFDSLPRELYEAAMMDGATEMQMYWKITIQLSKPVLAVIALGTFTMAYGSFMWAFLVLQNPKMWTLMVWLYQMQIWAPQFLVYAALVLTAIPTLTVFILCQNVIMRGIIVPSEK